ncbi:Protein red1 [Tolypocladium ophioglossoides CBS 100239]|uniref:Protein red1 n=1 Tax=Tolypocladium ophioglossoides (strain CBS 100239) TaxID=1163406 RepID=A0A0L0N6R4_TOLOC|nr:Protein red1 [Tolypocladium ophioglossoides CBS 100239]
MGLLPPVLPKMSQSGHGYDTPKGYHAQPPFSNLQYPSYAKPSQSANEPANLSGQRHGDTAQQSYEYNRNIIPGLGLGFSPSGTEQQDPWARPQPGSGYSASQPPQHGGQSSNQVALKAGDSKRPNPVTARGSISGDGSEEGEVSEGEIEDLYGPRETEDDGNTVEVQAWPFDSAGVDTGDAMKEDQAILMTGVPARSQAAGAGSGWHTGHPGQSSTGRERSGSYSPYLSPREINCVEPAQTSAHRASPGTLDNRTPRTTSPNEVFEPPRLVTAQSGVTAPAAVQSVSTARQQARDAILRLWPLNIRYQNYLQEGVDGAILGGLFKDLGLDIPASANFYEDPKSNGSTEVEPPAPPESAVLSRSKTQPTSSEPATAQPARPLESEERKDRIARLLAAKGSKPVIATTVAAPTVTPTAAGAGPGQPSAAKKQSEKSRLLHQKMEALLKAREALTQSRSQHSAPTDPDAAKSEIDKTTISDVAAGSLTTNEDLSGSSEFSNPAAGPVDRAGQPSPSSIPGLFLSSTPQPSQISEPMAQKHRSTPTVADLHVKQSRRPFGQNMESRPLLINVSDDEDDAEMDIDSPGGPASPVNLAEASFQRSGVLRDSLSASNNIIPRPDPSPTSVATPSRNSGHNSGGEDLENMNKKIEAMKRKIAEAEARKKAKRSRQVSPTASQPNGSSRDDSAEATSMGHGLIAPVLSMAGSRMPANDTPIQSVPVSVLQERTSRSERMDQGAGHDRRSRSRAASERLPFIKARRKEQILRLQSLQSQMVNVEREIEESMVEEEKLKRDLVADSSDQDQSPPASHLGPLSVEGPLSVQPAEESAQSDAMDTTSGSPAASEESGNSHGDTTPQALERTDAATADIAGHPGDNKHSESGLGDASHTTPTNRDPERVDEEGVLSTQPQDHESGSIGETEDDVIMGEGGESAGDELEAGSDDYEPPDAESSAIEDISPSPPHSTPVAEAEAPPQSSSHAEPDASITGPIAPQISAGHAESSPEPGREVETVPLTQHVSGHLTSEQVGQAGQGSTSNTSQFHFVPYETPLQYFRAYRFHPQFSQSVAGGLRSLTYSNKIDVRKEVCPDELAGQGCPKGSQCEYQHFENMRTPDDQILLHLGAAGNYDDEKKQEYISGLRQLLTEYRNRKVKDFNTISQGIIEYRARFQGDRYKILPLGNVSI